MYYYHVPYNSFFIFTTFQYVQDDTWYKVNIDIVEYVSLRYHFGFWLIRMIQQMSYALITLASSVTPGHDWANNVLHCQMSNKGCLYGVSCWTYWNVMKMNRLLMLVSCMMRDSSTLFSMLCMLTMLQLQSVNWNYSFDNPNVDVINLNLMYQLIIHTWQVPWNHPAIDHMWRSQDMQVRLLVLISTQLLACQ